jgi:hypothetical protein
MELGWTVIELHAAAQVGRPIDTQKYDGMQLKWNMDTDEQVYIGDSAKGAKGLLNLTQVTPTNAPRPGRPPPLTKSGRALTGTEQCVGQLGLLHGAGRIC